MVSRLFAGAAITALIAAIVVTSYGRLPGPPSTPPPTETPAACVPTAHAAEFHNPEVAPGKVRWHASFAEAQAAARQSGKPVLLLHMMGQLDRQFC